MEDQGQFSQYDEAQMDEAQKKDLEEFVFGGYRMIYDQGNAILDLATQNQARKVDRVAQAGFIIAKRLDSSRIDQGKPPFPDEIKAVGGKHLVDKIIDFSEDAGMKSFSAQERNAALEAAYKQYMDDGIANRTIDPIQLAQGVEKVQPGAITNAMAKLPDDIPQKNDQRMSAAPQPAQAAEGAPEGQPAAPAGGAAPAQPGQEQVPEKKGLLSQPSPLERFLS